MSAPRRPAGFTAVELSIVLAILLILIPLVFNLHRQFQSRLDVSRARVECAAQMRQLTRAIRADRWQGRWNAAKGLTLTLPCGQVSYTLEGTQLLRQGTGTCGASRTIARDIESIHRQGSLIEVRLVRPLGPQSETRVALAMGVRP